MSYIEFLSKDDELDIQMLSAKDEQNNVCSMISDKELELENELKANKSDKKYIRSQKIERIKQKLYLRAVRRRIKKVNKRNSKFLELFKKNDGFIKLSKFKSIMGGLEFLQAGVEPNLKFEQDEFEGKKVVIKTKNLYLRTKESIRNDQTRYALYKSQKISEVLAISATISSLGKTVSDRNSNIKRIQKELKELRSKRKSIEKVLNSTVNDMIATSDEFTNDDTPRVMTIKKDS